MKDEFLINLSQTEFGEMKYSYEQELITVKKRYEFLKSILNKINNSTRASVVSTTPIVLPAANTEEAITLEDIKSEDKPKRTRTVKKKRGPKPFWGSFIVGRLRKRDEPMTYEALLNDAMVLNNIPIEKQQNTKLSLLNSAFRLRSEEKKIDTVGFKGKREKFIVLTKWMKEDGTLQAEYQVKLNTLASKLLGVEEVTN
jgi:hypothetical protein